MADKKEKSPPPANARPPVVFSSPMEEPNSGKGKIGILKPELRRIVQLLAISQVDVATEFLAHVLSDEKFAPLISEDPLRSESICALSHEYFNWLKEKARESKSHPSS